MKNYLFLQDYGTLSFLSLIFKTGRQISVKRDAEKSDTLVSLRPLPLFSQIAIFKSAYCKSVKSYQKVDNYKNEALFLIYTTNINT